MMPSFDGEVVPMPPVTEAILNDAAAKLQRGPILVGEQHTRATARVAIMSLLKARKVSFLSLEAPIGPIAMTKSDGQIRKDQQDDYFAKVTIMQPEGGPSLSAIAELAGSQHPKVPVYFHDMPYKHIALVSTDGRSGPRVEGSNYLRMAAGFMAAESADVRKLPTTDGDLVNRLAARNQFTCKYLRKKLGDGVRVLQGLLILAGSDHLRADRCGQHTIQKILKIADDRVYFWDE
jgi:hypothetical protein